MSLDRNPNWSQAEKALAIGLINEHYEGLFSRFKGSSSGAHLKAKLWQDIADSLNSSGSTQCVRTVENLKRMYANVKQRAKEKESFRRKTGGGPPQILSPSEEKVIEGLQGKPQLAGIHGGVDTSRRDSVLVDDYEPSVKCTKGNEPVKGTGGNALISTEKETMQLTQKSSSLDNSDSVRGTGDNALQSTDKETVQVFQKLSSLDNMDSMRVKGKKRKLAGDGLLDLERRRADIEIQLMIQRKEQEKEMFLLKTEIQKQQLAREKTLYDLKEQVLKENLKHAFELNYLQVQEL